MATLVLSDIHLGSLLSRAKELLQLLKRGGFTRLILVGDIFGSLDFARLTRDQFRLLDYIRRLSNPKRGIEVVWIEGNHDAGLIAVMSHLVGVTAYEVYTWDWNGKRCVAKHGHQYDYIDGDGWFPKLVSFIFLEIQKIPFLRRHVCTWLDKTTTAWQRLTPVVAKGAITYARKHGYDVALCGHTHEAWREERDGVLYINTGSWVSDVCTYVWMDDNGIELRTFEFLEPESTIGEAAA